MGRFLSLLKEKYGADQVDISYTLYPTHAIELAEEAANRCDAILSIGGDGTLHEVVNGVMQADNIKVPILCIPFGTGNDFCRTQNYAFNADKILYALENPKILPIDVIEVMSKSSKHYSINVCDIGLGGYTTDVLNRLRSRGLKFGLTYKMASIIGLWQYKPKTVGISIDGGARYEDQVLMLVVCNSSAFGNGYIIHPSADVQDGKMSVVIFNKVTIKDYLLQYKKLKRGQFIQHPQVKYVDCTSIKIDSCETLPYEMDGEYFLGTDFSFQILPSKLNIIAY